MLHIFRNKSISPKSSDSLRAELRKDLEVAIPPNGEVTTLLFVGVILTVGMLLISSLSSYLSHDDSHLNGGLNANGRMLLAMAFILALYTFRRKTAAEQLGVPDFELDRSMIWNNYKVVGLMFALTTFIWVSVAPVAVMLLPVYKLTMGEVMIDIFFLALCGNTVYILVDYIYNVWGRKPLFDYTSKDTYKGFYNRLLAGYIVSTIFTLVLGYCLGVVDTTSVEVGYASGMLGLSATIFLLLENNAEILNNINSKHLPEVYAYSLFYPYQLLAGFYWIVIMMLLITGQYVSADNIFSLNQGTIGWVLAVLASFMAALTTLLGALLGLLLMSRMEPGVYVVRKDTEHPTRIMLLDMVVIHLNKFNKY